MSDTQQSSSNEVGDETMLLDDGFSIVDDINIGGGSDTGATAAAKTTTTTQSGDTKGKGEAVPTKKNDGNKPEETSLNVAVKKEKSDEDSTSTDKTTTTTDEKKSSTNVTKNVPVPQPMKGDEKDVKPKMDITKKKLNETSFVWVSNISKFIKASKLKKHFSDCGKVNTAKVVTNGKVFFGYVEFDNVQSALNCIKIMNNTMLGGTKIIVSRNRPDVAKKSASNTSIKKPATPIKKPEVTKDEPKKIEEPPKAKEDEKTKTPNDNDDKTKKDTDDTKKQKDEETNNKKDDEIKKKDEEIKKKDDDVKKQKPKEDKKVEDKKVEKKKEEKPKKSKAEEYLKSKLMESNKRVSKLRVDLDRALIEISNLRRRLRTEEKRNRAEELRAEKYRTEMRNLTDELKHARADFEKEIHHLTKKHKMDMEKAEYHRDTINKQKDELKKREEDLNREYRKLEETKRIFEQMKRTRKSRSKSPIASKRYKFYAERSPPPAPKLTAEIHKPRQSSSYYEEKKTRPIYERLGDYGNKVYQKESNGNRHRSAYPGEIVGVPKNEWNTNVIGMSSTMSPSTSSTDWKKSSPFMKSPYMERFPTTQTSYPAAPSIFYPNNPSTNYDRSIFDKTRKY